MNNISTPRLFIRLILVFISALGVAGCSKNSVAVSPEPDDSVYPVDVDIRKIVLPTQGIDMASVFGNDDASDAVTFIVDADIDADETIERLYYYEGTPDTDFTTGYLNEITSESVADFLKQKKDEKSASEITVFVKPGVNATFGSFVALMEAVVANDFNNYFICQPSKVDTMLLRRFEVDKDRMIIKEPRSENSGMSYLSVGSVPVGHRVSIIVINGKVFMSISGDDNAAVQQLRKEILREAVGLYNKQCGADRKLKLTSEQEAEFGRMKAFGVPFGFLCDFIDMNDDERSDIVYELSEPHVGIPVEDFSGTHGRINEFQIWLQALINVSKEYDYDPESDYADLYDEIMSKGDVVVVVAESASAYSSVGKVLDILAGLNLKNIGVAVKKNHPSDFAGTDLYEEISTPSTVQQE